MLKRKLEEHLRTAEPVSSIPAVRRGRSAADTAPKECPKAQLLAGMQQIVNRELPDTRRCCGIQFGVSSAVVQAWMPDAETPSGIRWTGSGQGPYMDNTLRALGVVVRNSVTEQCEALLAASAASVWEEDLPSDAAAELHAAREAAMRLDDLAARRIALGHAVLAAARALAAKCMVLSVPLPLATVSLSLRTLRSRNGVAPGSEQAAAISAVGVDARLKHFKDKRDDGIFWGDSTDIERMARAGCVSSQVEREDLWREADASGAIIPPRSGAGCRAKMGAASASAPPPPAPTTLEGRTPVDIDGLIQCKELLKFARPIHEGETDDACWHASGMLRVVVLLGDASPDVLAAEGLAVAELIHRHMGQFLWESKVSLNGHVQVLQPAKRNEESMWSNREEQFCNELSTFAPKIAALLRRCAQDRHIWARAMSYGPHEPGSFHVDGPSAGSPLVRLPICFGEARAFEVCPKQWADEELRGLSLDDAMITPLARAGGGGAVVLLPHAYIRARGAKLYHRAGAGEGPGLTLVLEVRCDGSGYAGLAARLAKIGITLFMAD